MKNKKIAERAESRRKKAFAFFFLAWYFGANTDPVNLFDGCMYMPIAWRPY